MASNHTATSVIHALTKDFERFETAESTLTIPDEYRPSALQISFNPASNTGRFRVVGDPDVLMQVLRQALADPKNKGFRAAFVEHLPTLEQAAGY